jgi:hypothetical protein
MNFFHSYDVVGNGLKYIHYNLFNEFGFITIKLIVASDFVSTLFFTHKHWHIFLNKKFKSDAQKQV